MKFTKDDLPTLQKLLDVDAWEMYKNKQLPYPVPMFGPDFFTEVIEAAIKCIDQPVQK